MDGLAGADSTLGNWSDLTNAVFGKDSPQAKFLDKKIAESPNGRDEEVIAEESQMLYVLATLK